MRLESALERSWVARWVAALLALRYTSLIWQALQRSPEINGTFYGLQKPASYEKWYQETPDDFVFSLKAPRYATNRKVLAEAGDTIERFFASGVLLLRQKLGPINWQFAPTKKFDADDFEAFLKLLPASIEGQKLRHAVEVRHESFRTPEFIALARKYKVAVVLAADSEYPQIADITAPFVYARIMGTSEKQAKGYSTKALDAWAERAPARRGHHARRSRDLRGAARESRHARRLSICDQRLQGAQSGRRDGVAQEALNPPRRLPAGPPAMRPARVS
ncbi:hypothetical protein OKW41_003183 [Paraburkholderia sp. UCT70]